MLNETHDRLMRAKQRLRAKQKLDTMLREVEATLDRERQEHRRHRQILESEKADVDTLEGLGLTGLFYSILGTKEERLQQERQEYLAAKLKYEESVQAIEEIQSEIKRLELELGSCNEAQAEYDRVIEQKQELLSQREDQRGKQLLDLSERLADIEADRKELQEAVRAGETAQDALEQIRIELSAAENWGTWDMLGGGTLATWAKHSRIDSAKHQAQVAQRHLRRFQEELADADQRLRVSLGEIGGLSTFADYFFDGMIADWVVQSKVQNASEACGSTLRNVSVAVRECGRRLSESNQQIEQLIAERRELIERA